MTVQILENGVVIGIFDALPKKFRTGSIGFYANGKFGKGGKRYQTIISLVEIGSKPK